MHVVWFLARPGWIEKPVAVDTSEGESAEFKCRASGLPGPTITWFKNGVSFI